MSVLNALSVPLATSASPTRWFSSTTAKAVLIGTDGPDSLSTAGANSTLIGGAGDDTYTVWTNSIQIVEGPSGGIDTLISHSWRPVWFEHVENMQVLADNAAVRGNALDNIAIGGSGAQTLSGGLGNDVLTGGAGADLFVIRQGEGSDLITDFTPGTDRLRLEDYPFHSFDALRAALRQSGADTVIELGGGERLVLRNVTASALTARDVMLPVDPAMPGMRLTFNEEFDGFSASATGIGTVWKTTYKINDQLRTLSSNREAQYYSDSSVGVNPFGVQDGILAITAAPGSNPLNLPYNSGAITTAKSFAQQYGYFEVRAQLPAGQGFWPAFWLLPTTGAWPPEIDIFEVLGHDTGTIYTSFGSTVTAGQTFGNAVFTDVSSGFHTYGLDWQADRIRWYFDGTLIAEATTPSDMRQPMYMLLNLAVGDTGSWPGQYDSSMPTGTMLIDYVRVWQAGSGASVGSWVTGPDDVAGFGGIYTLNAEGTGARYDFGQSLIALRLDSTAFATNLVHNFTGTMLGDVVVGGPAQVNGSLGQGDDTFYFGTGASRVYGNAGNDTFLFTAGEIGRGVMILDFRADLANGGEHDQLRFEGFSANARLEYLGNSASNPSYQYYRVVDGTHVSPTITVVVVNTTAPLSSPDYLFVVPVGQPAPTDPWVRGPEDVAGFGGSYSLRADGTGDLYDFSKAGIPLRLDTAEMDTSLVHGFSGSAHDDVVRGGPAQVNGSLGQGDDTFHFGTGPSRVYGNGGDDTFVFTAGRIGPAAMVLDFRADLSDGGEHDLLRFEGFSANARLEPAGGPASNPSYQYFRVVDGAYVSPVITVVVVNTTSLLSVLDYVFAQG